MKSFSIYGNCQAKALMQTLLKNEVFANTYNYKDLKPIQTILEEEVHLAEAIFKEADLLLHQIVSNSYHIPSLRTASLKAYRKINSLSIAFPYTYFNAYFPELDTYHGTKSILSLVHDYNIMLGYVKGLSQQQISDLIQDQNFYSQPITLTIRNESIDSLSWRENLLETKISNYILHNYTKIKLFNIFNHPKGIIFDHIANQVFTLLKMPTIEESLLSETYLDSKSIIAPIYPSTHKNLNLQFKEEFTTYLTMNGYLQQDEVIFEFFKTYSQFNKDAMLQEIKIKKPFIIDLFKELDV